MKLLQSNQLTQIAPTKERNGVSGNWISGDHYLHILKIYIISHYWLVRLHLSFDLVSRNRDFWCQPRKGAFKYYVIKEVGAWVGQMMMFDDKVGGWEWLNDDEIKKYTRKKNFCLRAHHQCQNLLEIYLSFRGYHCTDQSNCDWFFFWKNEPELVCSM